MSIEESLRQAFDLLDGNRQQLHLVGPALPGAIEAAESRLGLRLPPSYRTFLEREGGGSVKGREIYGVVSNLEAAGPPNVVWRTMQERGSAKLPKRYVILVDFDDSSAIALDTDQRGRDGEYPVVRIWPGEDESMLVDSVVAKDFASFLSRFVQERLSM